MNETPVIEQSLLKMAGKFVYQDGSARPLHFMPMLGDVLLMTSELVALLSVKMMNSGFFDVHDEKVQNMLQCFMEHSSYPAAGICNKIIHSFNNSTIFEVHPGIGLFWEYFKYQHPDHYSCSYATYGAEQQRVLRSGLYGLQGEQIITVGHDEIHNQARNSISIYNQMSAIFYGEEECMSLESYLSLKDIAKVIILPVFFGTVSQHVTSIRGKQHRAYTTEQLKDLLDDTWQINFDARADPKLFLPLHGEARPQYVVCTAFKAEGVSAVGFSFNSDIDWPKITQIESSVAYSIYENSEVTLCNDDTTSTLNQLVRTHSEVKFLFLDAEGHVFHEYPIATNRDMDNLAGYVDKLFKYRDSALAAYLFEHGLSGHVLENAPFPLMRTRSPQLDWILQAMIASLYNAKKRKIKIFELGCTVCEHLDMLDLMLRVDSNNTLNAETVLTFCGIDISAQILDSARILHPEYSDDTFNLICAEGGDISKVNDKYDITFSVGVINHIHNPVQSLKELLQRTKTAFLGVVWITQQSNGFWTIVHSGRHYYFFSLQDLRDVQQELGGSFTALTYTPEENSTQRSSYIGLTLEDEALLGSLLLVWTRSEDHEIKGASMLPLGASFPKSYLDLLPQSVYTMTSL